MDIGISSAVFYPVETEKAIDKIIDLGFKKVELFLNCEREYEDAFIDLIKPKLDSAQVEVVSVHPYTSLMEGMLFFSEYSRRTEDGLQMYRKYFHAAQKLGAKYFTLHGNRTLSGTVNPQISMEENCKAISKLADAAKEYNVLITQENVSWCASASIEYLAELKRSLDGKIGFTLDLKQALRAGVAVEEYINVMGESLKNIHISDFSDEEVCLLPGNGKMDYNKFIEQIRGIGYQGDLIIEVYSSNYDDICQIGTAKQFLERKSLQ